MNFLVHRRPLHLSRRYLALLLYFNAVPAFITMLCVAFGWSGRERVGKPVSAAGIYGVPAESPCSCSRGFCWPARTGCTLSPDAASLDGPVACRSALEHLGIVPWIPVPWQFAPGVVGSYTAVPAERKQVMEAIGSG